MNMKKVITLLIFTLLSLLGMAQDLDWAFDLRVDNNIGGFYDYNEFNVDDAGNSVLTGLLLDTADFDPDSSVSHFLYSGPCHDAFLARYTANGDYSWAFRIDMNSVAGFNYFYINHVDFDGGGNVYIGGHIRGHVVFLDDATPDTLSGPQGHDDIFIAKVSYSGHVLWMKRMGGELDPTQLTGFDVTSDGDIFFTGTMVERLYFNYPSKARSTSIYADIRKGQEDYIAKLDLNGNYKWSRLITGPGNGLSLSLHADDKKNLFLAGHFGDSIFMDSVPNLLAVPYSTHDILLFKTDGWGNPLKVSPIWSSQFQKGLGITTLDRQGNLLLTARTNAGTLYLDSSHTITSTAFSLTFIARYDNNLVYRDNWQFDGASSTINSYYLDCSPDGNIHMIGTFFGNADFDLTSDTLFRQSQGPYNNPFLAIYDSTFSAVNVLNFEIFKGTSWFNISRVSSDQGNNIYLYGSVGDSCDLDPSADTFMLNGQFYPRLTPNCTYKGTIYGHGSALLARFKYCQPPSVVLGPGPASACLASNTSLFVSAVGDGPLHYQWFKDSKFLIGGANAFYPLNNVQYSDTGRYFCHLYNSCGEANSDTMNFEVLDCTGIKDWSKDAEILIYPNPSDGHFTLEVRAESLPEKLKLRILDNLGRTAYTQTIVKSRTSIECPSTMRNGVYLIEVSSGNRIWRDRFVLNR